jgi:hypothetical protein
VHDQDDFELRSRPSAMGFADIARGDALPVAPNL